MSIERARMRASRGQALVETLVVAIALVPLAVLVVLLGKYQSMQSATVAASRSLAFDCAARPQACADPAAAGWLAESIRTRHFERPDSAIDSGRVAAGSSHPLWRDRAGRPLLEQLSDIGAAVSPRSFNAGLNTAVGRASAADVSGIGVPTRAGFPASAPLGAVVQAAPGAADVLNRLAGPARFGLAINEGLLDARVEVRVAASHAGNQGFAQLDPLSLTMRARTAILSDAWGASGPQGGVASVASRSAAGARLDTLRETRISAGYQLTRWTLDLMGATGLEPSAGDFQYHGADPDAVPLDRIGQP
jgi:hypothetical protein